MIQATDIELRAGAELLLSGATFRVDSGDRVGLVGRNGAGKTTLTKVLAGQVQPAKGVIATSASVGYLPQDPRTGDLDVVAMDRILSARGLDDLIKRMRQCEIDMGSEDEKVRDCVACGQCWSYRRHSGSNAWDFIWWSAPQN